MDKDFNLPTPREEIFAARLDKAIRFHQENPDDPYGISNAVIAALVEVRNAYAEAYKVPPIGKARSV